MGTFTAQVALGWPTEDGIVPSHEAWLWENHRPAWVLEPTQSQLTGGSPDRSDRPGSLQSIHWIPEQLLEDGLLLLAMHGLGDKKLLNLAVEVLPELADTDSSGLKPGEAIFRDLQTIAVGNRDGAKALSRLRELSRTIPWGKLVVTVLGRSSLGPQLRVLERYPMDVEVCTVSYSRLRPNGAWSDGQGDQVVEGTLEPDSVRPPGQNS